MDNIAEYEARITAALDRIEQAMAQPAAAPVTLAEPAEEVVALKAALQAERDKTQQLETRVKAVSEKLVTRVEKWKVKATALEAELDTLRAEREAETNEIGQVLSELRTVIGGNS